MDKTLQLKIITALQDKLSGPMKKMQGNVGTSARSLKDLRDKLKALESTQRSVGQFRELSRGLTQTSAKMQAAQSTANALARGIKSTEQPTAAMRREFDQAVRASQRLKVEHQAQAQKLQGLRDRLNAAGVSTKSLVSAERNLRSGVQQTTQALKQQEQQLTRVAQRQRQMADARRNLDQGMMRNGALAGSGMAARGTGMYMGRKMKNLLHVGYDFEAAMSSTQAVTRIQNKDDPKMEALRQQARTLPLTSKFTDLEVAQGQFYLGRTGYTPDQIIKAMPGMLNLAASGGIDLGVTADIASNIQTAMNIPAEKMDHVADVLTAAFTRNNVDIPMLGESLKYSAAVGKEFGQTLESVTAATALLGSAGIQGSMAGTAMRAILSRVGNSKAVNELGVRTKDKNGDLRQLQDIMADIAKATQKMGNVERGEVFENISGRYAMTAFGALIEATKAGKYHGMVQSIGPDAVGESQRVAATMLNNLAGDATILHAAFENISVELFEKNSGWMRSMTMAAADYLHTFSEFLKEYPAVSKGIVMIGVGLAALLTVFGTLTIGVAGFVGPMLIMRFLLAKMGIALPTLGKLFAALVSPIRLVGTVLLWMGKAALANPIIATIAAIALAAALIYKYWEPIKAFFLDLWEQVKVAFAVGIAVATEFIYKYWEPIKAFFLGLWEEIKTAFGGGLEGISKLIINWSPLGLFYKVMAGVLSYFGIELPGKFTEFGSMIMHGLINGIKGMAGSVKESVVSMGSDVAGWFKEKLGINSPSRVFIGFGENISEGAAIGINKGHAVATQAAKLLSAGVLAASLMSPAGAAIQGASQPKFDMRPAITAQAVAGGRAAGGTAQAQIVMQGDTIEIHIHAAPGMNVEDLGRAVAAELDKRERNKQARVRSSLSDYGN